VMAALEDGTARAFQLTTPRQLAKIDVAQCRHPLTCISEIAVGLVCVGTRGGEVFAYGLRVNQPSAKTTPLIVDVPSEPLASAPSAAGGGSAAPTSTAVTSIRAHHSIIALHDGEGAGTAHETSVLLCWASGHVALLSTTYSQPARQPAEAIESTAMLVVVGDRLALQWTACTPTSGSTRRGGLVVGEFIEGRGAVVVGRECDLFMLRTADGEMIRQIDLTTVAVGGSPRSVPVREGGLEAKDANTAVTDLFLSRVQLPHTSAQEGLLLCVLTAGGNVIVLGSDLQVATTLRCGTVLPSAPRRRRESPPPTTDATSSQVVASLPPSQPSSLGVRGPLGGGMCGGRLVLTCGGGEAMAVMKLDVQ